MMPEEPSAVTASLLGAFGHDTREVLVPALLYKRVFIGEWYEALVSYEKDPVMRTALLEIARDTLRETIEVITAMRGWDAARLPPDDIAAFATELRRRLVLDLMDLKEGSNEALLLVAMRAPTQALRERFLRLADDDRRHADELRKLLGERPSELRAAASPTREGGGPLGVRAGRASGGTLGATVAADLAEVRDHGIEPRRLVLSAGALRHLRDEGHVRPDATAFGLPVDVDFGWDGECFAFVTSERVRLSELISMGGTAGDAADGLSS